jgi:hypothetical protein
VSRPAVLCGILPICLNREGVYKSLMRLMLSTRPIPGVGDGATLIVVCGGDHFCAGVGETDSIFSRIV